MGGEIVFNRQPDPLINSGMHSDIASIEVSTKKLSPWFQIPLPTFLTDIVRMANNYVTSSTLSMTASRNFIKTTDCSFMMCQRKIEEVAIEH